MLIIEDLKTRKTSWVSTRHGDNKNWRAKPGLVVMKFGEQLRSSIIREYQWYYIDYDGLKRELKTASGPLVEADDESPRNRKGKGKAKEVDDVAPKASGSGQRATRRKAQQEVDVQKPTSAKVKLAAGKKPRPVPAEPAIDVEGKCSLFSNSMFLTNF